MTDAEITRRKLLAVANDISSFPGEVDRFVDQEAGVVCYRFRSGGGAHTNYSGMSCLPIDDTDLKRGDDSAE